MTGCRMLRLWKRAGFHVTLHLSEPLAPERVSPRNRLHPTVSIHSRGGWTYIESGTDGNTGWWLEEDDANNNALSWTPAQPQLSGPSGWTFQSGTYTVPTGVAYVKLDGLMYTPTTAMVLRVDDGFLYDNRVSLSVAQNLDFLPFGEITSSDSGVTTHKFTGDERDAETNLDHTWFRNYSSQTGRWMTTDPAGLMAVSLDSPQSLNRYSYVNNMPLSYFDPLGLWTAPSCGTAEYGCPPSTPSPSPCSFLVLDCWGPSPTPPASCPPFITCPTGGGSSAGGADGGSGAGGGGLVPCLAGAGPLRPGQSYCGARLDPCANATLSATGVNIRENIAQAQSTISVGRMMGITGGSYNAARGTVGALFNYAMLVGTGGPQDVKNQRGPGTPQQRVDAGNISFGITCSFGTRFCQFSAGAAQSLAGHPNFGGTLATGFDTPRDNAGILVGQAMRAAGCHE